MSDLQVTLGEVNGDGRHHVTYQYGDLVFPDAIDMISAFQREESLKRAMRHFGTSPENLNDLSRQLASLAAQSEQRAISDNSGVSPRFIETLMTSAEFLALEIRSHYIVKNTVVALQPGVIGGRSKANKTNTTIDLVISVASGTPFLNHFPAEQITVGFWCGESGKAKTQGLAKRICGARGLDLAKLPIYWGFDLPKLCRTTDLEALCRVTHKRKLDLIVVDPLYLSLLTQETAGNAGNVYAMGATLEPLSELSKSATVLLVHHFRKNTEERDSDPCPLDELSQAGVAEWARQWILWGRRTPYQNDGRHEMFMRCGGSEGHASLWSVTIDEGKTETPEGEEKLTKWEVAVDKVGDVKDQIKRERENRKAAEMERKESEHVERVVATLRPFPEGETVRVIKTAARLNTDNTDRALLTLKKNGRVEQCEVQKGGSKHVAFRLKK